MNKIHSIVTKVYYEDTDSTGFVYHTSYLKYAERARTELLKSSFNELVNEIKKSNFFFVIRSAKIKFIKPANLFDELRINSFLIDCRQFSISLLQEFSKKNEIICKLEVQLVWVNGNDKKPKKLPTNIISRFKSLEVV